MTFKMTAWKQTSAELTYFDTTMFTRTKIFTLHLFRFSYDFNKIIFVKVSTTLDKVVAKKDERSVLPSRRHYSSEASVLRGASISSACPSILQWLFDLGYYKRSLFNSFIGEYISLNVFWIHFSRVYLGLLQVRVISVQCVSFREKFPWFCIAL